MAGRVRKNSAQDAVYTILKNGIMSLQLPPGTVISTQEMATRLNVSRTPVREAFIRLQEENLVDMFPQRETVVSRIDLERVLQERFIRESLEAAAVELFMDTCRPEHLQRMRDCIKEQERLLKEKDYAGFIRSDNSMHGIIFEAAGQKLAGDTIMNVNGHYDRFRILTMQDEKTMENAIRQHEHIVDLMEQGDKEQVRRELYDHVRKLNYEKEEMLRKYPDYFATEETTDPFKIRSL